MVLQMLDDRGPRLRHGRRRQVGAEIEIVPDLAEDPRPALRRTADHDRVGAGLLEHTPRLLGRRDVAVGDHRDRDRGPDGTDRVVFDRTDIGAGAGAAVNGKRANAGALGDPRDAQRIAVRRIGPVRIFDVTGTSTARTTASRIDATSGSFASSAEPAAALQTFFAGQPMLMSMICAPRSTL